MKQNPFKVGDRARVYEGDQTLDTTITQIESDYIWPCHKVGGAHWKQCRRLVKKPRKTIWVNEYSRGRLMGDAYESEKEAKSCSNSAVSRVAVPYREVKVKK